MIKLTREVNARMATDIRSSTQTIHIKATSSSEWVVESHEVGLIGSFLTEGEAVARAWDFASRWPDCDLVVQSQTGTIHCHLSFTQPDPLEAKRQEYMDEEDERLSREVEKNLPSFEELCRRLDRIPKQMLDLSSEDDELPC